jgi:hypothetical protein
MFNIVAEDLCEFKKGQRIIPYALHCLSQLIHAITLYDTIIVYDYRPSQLFIEMSEDGEEIYHPKDVPIQDAKHSHLASQLDDCLFFYDPYESLTYEEKSWLQVEIIENAVFDLKDGSRGIPGFAECPLNIISKNQRILSNPDISAVEKGLETFGASYYFDEIIPSQRRRFASQYTGNIIWQMEVSRAVCNENHATGQTILPNWSLFWEKERRLIVSALHEKFVEVENAIIAKHFGGEIGIDFSPLTVVALERTSAAEGLAETLRQMRADYSDLRDTGRYHSSQLEEAVTYAEVSNIIENWREAWDIILKRISKTEKPFFHKLFGWDVIKKASLKYVFLNSIEVIAKEIKDLGIIKRLSFLYEFEEDFLRSKRIERRIQDLYSTQIDWRK